CGVTGFPNAAVIASSCRAWPTGSKRCQRMAGYCCASAAICRISVGEIVEPEDGRLHESVALAARHRMVGIAVELGRPPGVSRGNDWLGVAFEQNGCCVIARHARHQLFRLIDVRQRVVGVGLLTAACEPRKQKGSAHQLEKLTPARIVEHRGGGGKFPRKPDSEALLVDQFLEARPEALAPVP